jgi:hypothetical protein
VAYTSAAPSGAAVTPNTTPPDSLCRGLGFYGWFGVAPGSVAEVGGVANDLWWDAKDNASPTQVQIYSGNGGANQQWCEQDHGYGVYSFFSLYASLGRQCLTIQNGSIDQYQAGLRVLAEPCNGTNLGLDQLWYVCPRSGNSISLESSVENPWNTWLDVWGGTSDNGASAFKPLNPLQIWTGNGQDNQRFTLYPSPGEPSSLPYRYTSGVAGC